MYIKSVKIFEYKKYSNGYWNGAKLYQQIVNKALPKAEAIYPSYSLLYFFDNITNYSIYAKNVL